METISCFVERYRYLFTERSLAVVVVGVDIVLACDVMKRVEVKLAA